MTYDNFKNYVRDKCNYETIYDDGEGRVILVITLLDAYTMTHRAPKDWVGLTGTEINHIFAANVGYPERMMDEVAKLLKEKNNE